MGKIERQGNVTNVPSLNALLKSSDYHFIMLFKNNNVTKELMIEYLDPTVEKTFKLACIDKAINFLQIMKSKISGKEQDTKALMKETNASLVTLQEVLMSHVINLPIDKSNIKYIFETIQIYFKNIKHKINIIAAKNRVIIKIKSEDPEKITVFNEFKRKFWNRYYNEVLKNSLGDFDILINIE